MERFGLLSLLVSLALMGCASDDETVAQPGPTPPEQPTPPAGDPPPDEPDPGDDPAPDVQSAVGGNFEGQEVVLSTALLLDFDSTDVRTQVIAIATGVSCDLDSFTGVTLIAGPCDPFAPDITTGSYSLTGGDCEGGGPDWTSLVEVDGSDHAYTEAGTVTIEVDDRGAMTGTIDVELDSGDTLSGTFAIADSCLVALD